MMHGLTMLNVEHAELSLACTTGVLAGGNKTSASL